MNRLENDKETVEEFGKALVKLIEEIKKGEHPHLMKKTRKKI